MIFSLLKIRNFFPLNHHYHHHLYDDPHRLFKLDRNCVASNRHREISTRFMFFFKCLPSRRSISFFLTLQHECCGGGNGVESIVMVVYKGGRIFF